MPTVDVYWVLLWLLDMLECEVAVQRVRLWAMQVDYPVNFSGCDIPTDWDVSSTMLNMSDNLSTKLRPAHHKAVFLCGFWAVVMPPSKAPREQCGKEILHHNEH